MSRLLSGVHLSEDVLIDLAEGAVAETSTPHLSDCKECRLRLADVRTMMTAAVDVNVPEPSPLFWEHLSARVREAVAAEPPPQVSWSARWLSWNVVAPAALGAVALAIVALRFQTGPAPTEPAIVADSSVETVDMPSDDPSWNLITELAADLDWDAAVDAGMAPAGGVDRAVFDLDADERRELQRLLQEELARSGV